MGVRRATDRLQSQEKAGRPAGEPPWPLGRLQLRLRSRLTSSWLAPLDPHALSKTSCAMSGRDRKRRLQRSSGACPDYELDSSPNEREKGRRQARRRRRRTQNTNRRSPACDRPPRGEAVLAMGQHTSNRLDQPVLDQARSLGSARMGTKRVPKVDLTASGRPAEILVIRFAS